MTDMMQEKTPQFTGRASNTALAVQQQWHHTSGTTALAVQQHWQHTSGTTALALHKFRQGNPKALAVQQRRHIYDSTKSHRSDNQPKAGAKVYQTKLTSIVMTPSTNPCLTLSGLLAIAFLATAMRDGLLQPTTLIGRDTWLSAYLVGPPDFKLATLTAVYLPQLA